MTEFRLGELLHERRGEGYKLYARHSNPVFVRMLKLIGFDREWASADGPYLIDRDGTRFLDMLGGYGMFNVGRNNPTVRRALEEALALGTPSLPQLGLSDLPGLLAEALCAVAPASTDRVLFTNSGAESIEAALKLGRTATGRTRIVANLGGFHGLTLGALSINGAPVFRERFEPLLPGVALVPFNDLDALEAELRSEDVALFVVEPVQGHGVHLPEPGYLEGAQELCRRYGTLFCVDEVQTGLGRTGKLFALEHWGLQPDLVTTAKSLSGGYVATGALLLSRMVHEAVFDSLEHGTAHGSTFAPNDLAMAAGLATLHELADKGLVEHSARMGELLLELTGPLVERFEAVKEVRGLGLLWAIEFEEPASRQRSWRLLERIQPGFFSQLVIGPLFSKHNVLAQVAGHHVNVIKAIPPLVVSEADIEWFADALAQSIAKAERIPRATLGFAARAATRV